MSATFETINEDGILLGISSAVHGMRQPMKSFSRSDTPINCSADDISLGENDYNLAKKLVNAGPEHAKYLRMIPVWVDITAPLYFWSEFDTYKIGTTANSTSTMHTLSKDNLDEAFCFPRGIMEEADAEFDELINVLKLIQEKMKISNNEERKKLKVVFKSLLPSCFLYTRTVCLNYQTLQTMYKQRYSHQLSEWNTDFVNWVESLPYSELITGKF